MEIKSFVFNPFYENTYLLYDGSKEAVVIDPGCYEKFEEEELIDYVNEKQLKVVKIINTHCHIDHVLGNYALKTAFDCPLWIPEGEAENFRAVSVYSSQWGIQKYQEAAVEHLIKQDETITFGNTQLKTIYAPGHSPGHLVFFHETDQTLVGGDVLFRESIGRTDLPWGNHDQLLNSIREKIYTLPQNTVVYPGHGPTTTVGHEMQNNPFVKA